MPVLANTNRRHTDLWRWPAGVSTEYSNKGVAKELFCAGVEDSARVAGIHRLALDSDAATDG